MLFKICCKVSVISLSLSLSLYIYIYIFVYVFAETIYIPFYLDNWIMV